MPLVNYKREELDLLKLAGMIKVVSTAPTYVPKKFFDQVLLYASGATYRLYIYDNVNNAWRYTTLT